MFIYLHYILLYKLCITPCLSFFLIFMFKKILSGFVKNNFLQLQYFTCYCIKWAIIDIDRSCFQDASNESMNVRFQPKLKMWGQWKASETISQPYLYLNHWLKEGWFNPTPLCEDNLLDEKVFLNQKNFSILSTWSL